MEDREQDMSTQSFQVLKYAGNKMKLDHLKRERLRRETSARKVRHGCLEGVSPDRNDKKQGGKTWRKRKQKGQQRQRWWGRTFGRF